MRFGWWELDKVCITSGSATSDSPPYAECCRVLRKSRYYTANSESGSTGKEEIDWTEDGCETSDARIRAGRSDLSRRWS